MAGLLGFCAVFVLTSAGLLIKIIRLRRTADEICAELEEKLHTDTNTLISISSGDRHMKQLAAALNEQLKLLRDERRHFRSGDRRLKETVTHISHDLRTPLTAVCGYLDLLEREEKSEAVGRYLGIIKNRTEALKALTEELFSYSLTALAEDKAERETVIINHVLEESVSAYYAALKARGISPVISMPEQNVTRVLDRNALSRIFENVIGNAVKYSAGDLHIRLTGDGEIIFTNSAPELDKLQAAKLFDRFYTVEDARKSTGLGLSIAKLLTEQMNGTIRAGYEHRRLSIHILFPDKK